MDVQTRRIQHDLLAFSKAFSDFDTLVIASSNRHRTTFDFLAICSGFGVRLVESHVAKHEANTQLVQEQVKQEKIAAQKEALEFAKEIGRGIGFVSH